MNKLASQEDFNLFDSEHPEFWEMFKKFTFEVVDSGRKKFSARTVSERMRWFTEIDSGERYKVNNNWVPFYARKFIEHYPEHDKLFETRGQRE